MPVSLFLIKLLAFMMEAASIGVDFNLDTRITTEVKTSSPSNRTTARWRTALKNNYHVMSLSPRNVNKEWTFPFLETTKSPPLPKVVVKFCTDFVGKVRISCDIIFFNNIYLNYNNLHSMCPLWSLWTWSYIWLYFQQNFDIW